MERAKDFVPCGTLSQMRGGDMFYIFLPYFWGISCPSSNAGAFSINMLGDSVPDSLVCGFRWFSTLVNRNDHAVRCGSGIDEPQSGMRASLSEEEFSCSQDQRMDQENVLINEVLLHQGLDQFAAAQHHQVFVLLGFE